MNFSRNKIWIIPLLIVAAAPLWKPPLASFLEPRESKVKYDKKSTNGDKRNLHLYGVTMNHHTGDRLEMVLKADSVATGEKDKDEFFFTNINCQIFDEQGRATQVRGGEALLATDKNLITIIEDVQVVSADGQYRISTDALRYFTTYKVAKTATPVHFVSGQTEINGNSMMYNLTTGCFRVGGGVTCKM